MSSSLDPSVVLAYTEGTTLSIEFSRQNTGVDLSFSFSGKSHVWARLASVFQEQVRALPMGGIAGHGVQ